MDIGKIILIDDKPDIRDSHKNSIQKFCTSESIIVEVDAWDKDAIEEKFEQQNVEEDDDSNASEDKLFRIFKNTKNLSLVIVDRDLSGINNILTESSVINACLQVGVPVCTYHRKPKNKSQSGNLTQIIRQSNSYSIAVEVGEEFAKSVIEVALGFKNILENIPGNLQDPFLKSPSKVLASILGFKNISIYLDQYSQSSTLASFIIGQADELKEKSDENYRKRLSFVIGCWLHNHILAFPGIILNKIAACSYINISEETLTKYKDEFEGCKYKGPFGRYTPYWIRVHLDEFLEDYDDGYEFLTKKHSNDKEISKCMCSMDNTLEAGYYCVINQKPISLQKSVGKLSWIPGGADLCRVDRDTYDQIAPLMGL